MKNLTLPSKLTLGLIIFLPLFFMVAALGTKFGIWGYQTGLIAMTFGAGRYILGVVALVALIALIRALVRKPRRGIAIVIAVIGLIVPAVFAAWGASVGGVASANPIHDVATDTANPPEFSKATMAAREKSGSNPLNDYQTPLGQLEKYKGSSNELKIRSHAQIITKRYAGLSPLPLAGASQADAMAAVAAGMEDMGLTQIKSDEKSGRVEGVAETFWYGFKDDVVARVGEAQIDFRSVSRVGTSDLGANAARIEELRSKVEALLGQR